VAPPVPSSRALMALLACVACRGGRASPADRDDAAVAGGLVAHGPGGPCFLGDAIADPLSGIAAATAAAELVAAGRSGLVDVAMAGVAASFAPRRAPT